MQVRASLLFAALFTLGSYSSFAQGRLRNQPNYDRKPLHFGFNVGLNFWDFHLQTIPDLAGYPGYYSVRSVVQPGYNIGIISNLRLSDHMDLRLIPAFASTERTLFFTVDNPNTGKQVEVERKVQSSFIEVPLLLKYKSDRIKNYRMYVVGGMKYNYDLSSKEDVLDDRFFKIKSSDLAYEFGFGLDFYFEYFKFSPQIKGSWGIRNLLVQDETFFVEGLERVESRCVMISLNFE